MRIVRGRELHKTDGCDQGEAYVRRVWRYKSIQWEEKNVVVVCCCPYEFNLYRSSRNKKNGYPPSLSSSSSLS